MTKSPDTALVIRCGRFAMWVTLAYTTVGIGMQAERIVRTGETPSLPMMILAALTFLSWTVWAGLKRPREMHVIIPNSIGCVLSVIVVVLSLCATAESIPTNEERTTRVKPTTHASIAVTGEEVLHD